MARKTVRARRLGKQIRKLRERAGLSQEQLCEWINSGQVRSTLSQGQLSRVEAGSARLDADQLARILTVVQADQTTATQLEALRARAEEPGWWRAYSPYVPETLEMAIELGEDASEIRTYDTVFVQGLVQTADYARAVIESAKAFVRPTVVDELVELRMRRQERLAEDDFRGLTAVITEASVRHLVGNPAIMRRQLQHLCQITEEGLAAVHVLPYSAGPWPGIGNYAIYSFPDEEDAEIAQVDGDLGAGIYEDKESVKALTFTFDAALARALPARESLALYHAVLREWE